ncbi:MAG: hypothetical protein KF819_09610 [Labilithrix sp.]|nr:hypothetical protein [Labilithrix sp.]
MSQSELACITDVDDTPTLDLTPLEHARLLARIFDDEDDVITLEMDAPRSSAPTLRSAAITAAIAEATRMKSAPAPTNAAIERQTRLVIAGIWALAIAIVGLLTFLTLAA